MGCLEGRQLDGGGRMNNRYDDLTVDELWELYSQVRARIRYLMFLGVEEE